MACTLAKTRAGNQAPNPRRYAKTKPGRETGPGRGNPPKPQNSRSLDISRIRVYI
jgi:hypothetical protein